MRLFATAVVGLTLLAFGAQAQPADTTAPDITAPAPASKHKSTHSKHRTKHSAKHTKPSSDTASR